MMGISSTSDSTSEDWSDGVMEYWVKGIMEYWNVGSKEAVRLKGPLFHFSIIPSFPCDVLQVFQST
jgi:hypothetical protein